MAGKGIRQSQPAGYSAQLKRCCLRGWCNRVVDQPRPMHSESRHAEPLERAWTGADCVSERIACLSHGVFDKWIQTVIPLEQN